MVYYISNSAAYFGGEVRVRVRGSQEGGVRVWILELNSTSSQFSDQIITHYEQMLSPYVLA